MSTKSSFKVTSGLDVIGNQNLNGDLEVAGKLKINGSAGTVGQVLVSGGADADPIWVNNSQLANSPGFYLWGPNQLGSLGTGNINNSSIPIQTICKGTDWEYINATSAIKTDGTLWVWGRNEFGQLGDETILHKSSPVQTIAGGTNWSSVDCGHGFTAAIKTDGTLWTWGYNYFASLGDGSVISKSSPVQTIAGGTNWSKVSCGGGHTAAIKTDGTLWTWGYCGYGQLGDNSTISKSSPVQTIAGGTNWSKVSCGGGHTAAIKTDGTLWVWGYNNDGQLGIGNTNNKSSPLQIISGGTDWSSISCGAHQTAAIKTDGTLWTWGVNDVRNGIPGSVSPIQSFTNGTNWSKISCGIDNFAAIKTDGTLWTWGYNTNGQLGNGTLDTKIFPLQIIVEGLIWKDVVCSNVTVSGNVAAITF